jgi:predicted CoA-binding protein
VKTNTITNKDHLMNKMNTKINTNIEKILKNHKNIAIVGMSDSPVKDSYKVGLYLQKAGYNIYPVNPKYEAILANQCYPNLKAIPDSIEIVNIFRKPEQVVPIIKEAIEIQAKVVWMQLGVINTEAAVFALEAGLQVVMDHCIKIEHRHHYPDALSI